MSNELDTTHIKFAEGWRRVRRNTLTPRADGIVSGWCRQAVPRRGAPISGSASIISHLLTKDEMPSGAELRLFVRISGGGLSTVVTPGILFLGLAVIGLQVLAKSV